MQKKLTITIEENIYNDLHLVVGKGKISKFIERIIKPYITKDNLRLAYQTMAKDKQREKESAQYAERKHIKLMSRQEKDPCLKILRRQENEFS